MRALSTIFLVFFLHGCNTHLLDGQDFSYYQKPIPREANLVQENNIDLSLIEVSSLSPQVLDSMPKISGAKIPADLRNVSFDPLLDNSFPEYIIGPGDTIEILFPSDNDVNRITSRGLKVDSRGEIEFPYLGRYNISGFTPIEAKELLVSALSDLYVDPEIFLSVKKFISNKAFISGSFEGGLGDTGTSSIKTKMINLNDVPITILEALDQAGVSFSEATPNPFLILNRNKKNHIVDLGFITNNANPNVYVKNNDIIYLPSQGDQKIYVTGAVSSDRIINYSSTMTLSEALLNSSLDKSAANLEEIYVLRVTQTINNKLRGIAYKVDLKSPTSLMLADNFYLLDKDIIFVSSFKVTRWNQTMSRMLSSLDFINLWKSYKPINSEVFRTQ
ncbi:MAG: polysaccharide biosynthesis/export family protein [Candidatus Pelagibacterales bacterium]